jgi:hypothetical protein
MSVLDVHYAPLHWKLKALAYEDVLSKAKPGLEAIAEQRARAKLKERKFLGLQK